MLKAGAASSDITPPIGTPMFAYTARSNLANPEGLLQVLGDPDPDDNLYAKTFVPSEGIHTRVRARALVVEQDGKKFALVQADLGGLPFALTQEVMSRIEDTGITADRLLISATHTHSSTGPIWPPLDNLGYGVLGGDAFDPRIFELTAEGIAEAIRTADERLEPAKLGVGSTSLTGASRNREFDTFKRNPEAPVDPDEAKAASIDDKLWVVRADSRDGRPLAVWSNFAIHPTSFGDENLLFSGDNAASAERIAEAQIAEEAAAAGTPVRPDREVVNVWTNGNQGDISPNGGPDVDGSDPLQYVPNSSASAHMAGRRVAAGIVDAWRDAGSSMGDELEIDARRTIFAFDGMPLDSPVGPFPVLGSGGIIEDDGVCSPVGIPGQAPKKPIATGPLAPSTAPVSVWRVGSLGIAAFPSEITKVQGDRIKNALVAGSGGEITNFALAGLTNSYLSYTATPEEYDGCTYEGSFTLFGRLQGPRYQQEAEGVLASLVAGEDAATLPEPPPSGLGGDAPTVDQTPDAGAVVTQPADTTRFGRVGFAWKGGDAAIDAPRNATFVALQRDVGGEWTKVGTDDGFLDTTVFDEGTGVWTETWQFGECDPLGTYRFVVTGVADKGSGPAPYTVTSDEFELTAMPPLVVDPVSVTGTTATVVARYPDPGPDALIALPRRVRKGSATLDVNGDSVKAELDGERLRFTAPVPAGATVSVDGVQDECGNTGG